MAEEKKEQEQQGGSVDAPPKKAPPCPPPGLPGWMGTFTDLAILLLTFFVLLLSFCRTETEKYEAALGSIRNAFGGNVLHHGEVIQEGKSPDDSPTMLDSAEPIQPFPIEFLTTEGLLERHEINRESEEDLRQMRYHLEQYELSENVELFEMPEGIRVKINENILFEEGSIIPSDVTIEVYDRLVKMLGETDWIVYVEGHASSGEVSAEGEDAYELSARRSLAVSRSLARRGVPSQNIVTLFFGDSRPLNLTDASYETSQKRSRRVEFSLRKTYHNSGGHKVRAR